MTSEMLDSIASHPDETTRAELLRLVAIDRAALVWSEASLAYMNASARVEESNESMNDALFKLEELRKAKAALRVAVRGAP